MILTPTTVLLGLLSIVAMLLLAAFVYLRLRFGPRGTGVPRTGPSFRDTERDPATQPLDIDDGDGQDPPTVKL